MNDVDKHRQTVLHVAAGNNRSTIISVLLESGVEPDAMDEKGNNGTARKNERTSLHFHQIGGDYHEKCAVSLDLCLVHRLRSLCENL